MGCGKSTIAGRTPVWPHFGNLTCDGDDDSDGDGGDNTFEHLAGEKAPLVIRRFVTRFPRLLRMSG